MEYFKSNCSQFSIIVFVFFIVVAHVFATDNYNFTKNTISDLGAQAYSRKWIMQIGFLTFGMTLATGVFMNGFSFRTLPILIYALCVALTGVFCTKPFFQYSSFSETESTLHAVFAQIAGVTFSIGILTQIFFETDKSVKTTHFLFFLLVIGLSISFGLLKNYQGIAQRLLYLISFIWLIKFYKL